MNGLLLSAILGVIMMFSGVLLKRKASVKGLAMAGMVVLWIANLLDQKGIHFFSIDVSAFLSFNFYSLFFNSVIVGCSLLYVLLSGDEMKKVGDNYAEYYALIFFVLTGVFLVSSFTSLLILFIGIEIISIPLYILTGADKKSLKSNEAALKYFLMGAFSTGIMLMGITLIYGAQGTFNVLQMKAVGGNLPPKLMFTGILFLLFSISFKVSIAPFHFWTPDVYDGAPTVFTSFMATIVKVAIFIGFIQLFKSGFGHESNMWQPWIVALATATLFVGNITAVFQQSVKRMLAYSSISQAGFMLFSIIALNETAYSGLLIYAVGYTLATIGIFGILAKMSDYSFEGFNGLAKHHPTIAVAVMICLLSLAGIPLTTGFWAKFYMLKAVMETGQYLWLVIVGVIMAAISAYYYFRVIQAMYFKEGPDHLTAVSRLEKYTLIVVAALLVIFGIFPNLLLNWLYF